MLFKNITSGYFDFRVLKMVLKNKLLFNYNNFKNVIYGYFLTKMSLFQKLYENCVENVDLVENENYLVKIPWYNVSSRSLVNVISLFFKIRHKRYIDHKYYRSNDTYKYYNKYRHEKIRYNFYRKFLSFYNYIYFFNIYKHTFYYYLSIIPFKISNNIIRNFKRSTFFNLNKIKLGLSVYKKYLFSSKWIKKSLTLKDEKLKKKKYKVGLLMFNHILDPFY
jgi:hypothetical protein